MEYSAPPVAIVIPFIEWNDFVAESVQGCGRLAYENFQIVLVPNEADGIPEEITADSRTSVVASEVSNISRKRNVGMKHCPDAEFYAFIDSDAYPDPQWLANGVSLLADDSTLWAVTGPNVSPDYADLKRQAVANALHSVMTTGGRSFMKNAHAAAVENANTAKVHLYPGASKKPCAVPAAIPDPLSLSLFVST